MTSSCGDKLEGEGVLRSCPFCGGEARLDVGMMAFEDVEISCVSCGMNGPNYDDGFGREDNARLATAAWNHRWEIVMDKQEQPVEYSPVDDELARAFIDGWNARLDHTDFDLALHYWMLAGITHIDGVPIDDALSQGSSNVIR